MKVHLATIARQFIFLDDDESIRRQVLVELFREKNFNVIDDPTLNNQGYITMTLKPSQAMALSKVEYAMEINGENKLYIESFFSDLSYKLSVALLEIPQIKLIPKSYDSGRLAASEEHLRLENGIHE